MLKPKRKEKHQEEIEILKEISAFLEGIVFCGLRLTITSIINP